MLATLPDRPERTALQPPILLPFADGMHEGNGSATPPSLDGAPAFHDDPTLHADISTPLAPSGAEKQECLKEAVQRLAGLPKLDYEVIRKTEAIRLDVRPSFLDQAVEAARSDEDQEPPEEMFPDVEPWDEPVDANQLLDEVHATIRSFIVCDKAASITATLWIAFTWFIDFVQVAPIAVITAPQKRCGKSQLLDVMAKISCRPLVASSVTPAALFRVIEGHKPTLFIDEADTFLKENEMLRGIQNS